MDHDDEKRALFSFRYGVSGDRLRELLKFSRTRGAPLGAVLHRVPWWRRFWWTIVGVRCMSCGITMNDSYWQSRGYGTKPFDQHIRLICNDRHRCMECAMQEDWLEREDRHE